MAPQTSIPLAANILGTIGTVCWCVQLIPQVWRNYRTKSTEGLPPLMMLIWSISGVPFGVYAVSQRFNIPLIIQPQCFCALCGVSFAQCLIYAKKWRTWTATLLLVFLFVIFGVVEAGLIFTVGPAYARGINWPVTLVGILAFVTMITGFFPVPLELLKRRGRIVGIDFVFLTVDWCGAFFSLMALVAQNEFDVLFGTMYAMICAIEISIVSSHLIWLWRTREIRQRAMESGQAFDESAECMEWQGQGIDLEKKFRNMISRKAPADPENSVSSKKSFDTLVDSERGNSTVVPDDLV